MVGLFGYVHYSAAKWALRGFAESMAMEMREFGTKITLAVPGDLDTPGYEEEMKVTPEENFELRFVDETPMNTDKPAQLLLRDISRGEFFSSSCMDTWLLTTVGASCSPLTSWCSALTQVLIMGPLRVVVFVVFALFNRTVDRMAHERKKKKI